MRENFLFEDVQEYSPIVEIESEASIKANVRLYLKQEYLIHEQLSGNKYRKLKYNLLQARKEGKNKLLTFGGAYSNHIAAVARAGHMFGFDTTAIIRGEAPQMPGFTLRNAIKNGMQLHFVSRSAYRQKEQILEEMQLDVSQTYIIPEGGTNSLSLKGAAEIVQHTNLETFIDYWCAACGTGGTAAGIISALNEQERFIGFSVLKVIS